MCPLVVELFRQLSFKARLSDPFDIPVMIYQFKLNIISFTNVLFFFVVVFFSSKNLKCVLGPSYRSYTSKYM